MVLSVRLFTAVVTAVTAMTSVPASGATAVADPGYRLVSVTPRGEPGNGSSYDAVISANGRWVAFSSFATNLTGPGSRGTERRALLRDPRSGTTTELAPRGDGDSHVVDVSADGSIVLLVSLATNLTRRRTDGERHLFVWRRDNGRMTQVDLTSRGRQPAEGQVSGAALSADGSVIAFVSTSDDLVQRQVTSGQHLYRHDLRTGRTTVLDARADDVSRTPTIDGDGDTIVYSSKASNLVPGQVEGGAHALLLWKQGEGLRALVDGANGSSYDSDLSRDGRTVAFETGASLVPGDDHQAADVYTVDIATGEFTRLTQTDQNAESFGATITDRGRWVALVSYARLVPEDTDDDLDVYRYRQGVEEPKLLTAGTDDYVSRPSLSGNGSRLVLDALDSSLVPGDDNGQFDVLLAVLPTA